MISIELKDDVVYQFGESEIKKIPDHLPFGNQFDIEFPVHVFLTKNQVLDDCKKYTEQVGRKTNPFTLIKYAEEYVDQNFKLKVKILEDKIYMVLIEPQGSIIFKANISRIFPMPNVLQNEFVPKEGEFHFAYKLNKIITNTLQYVNKPVVKKTKRTTKVNKKYHKKYNRNKSQSSPTYIKKTQYTISSVEDKDRVIQKHDYNRIKDSWLVRGHYREGHWRTYTDSEGNQKKTWVKGSWVKPHVRGDGDDNPDQKYKITDTN